MSLCVHIIRGSLPKVTTHADTVMCPFTDVTTSPEAITHPLITTSTPVAMTTVKVFRMNNFETETQ